MPCWRHGVCRPFKGNSGPLNLALSFLDDSCLDSVLPMWKSLVVPFSSALPESMLAESLRELCAL